MKDETIFDMKTTDTLQNLLNGNATEEDIVLLKRLLASGEISIGGNVNNSTIVQGSGNNVQVFQLTPDLLEILDGRKYLSNLDRDLTGEEIASGLRRLDKLLPNRAPILLPHYKEQVGRLRPTLKTEVKSLSETSRRERVESLAAINSICVEALDVSFNGLSLGEEAPKYDARSPFRGLESFRPEDSEFFFGRKALTEKLVGKIKAHSFLAVLGASGSGKSSLVMAGVIPALDLDYAIIRPGENPLEALESAKGKALLVVDQFEELFTLTKNEDKQIRADFISAVLDFARSGKVIITLRSDFLSEVGAYRSLSKEIQNHLETILPMDTDGLRRAMEGQARLTKLEFEADLSQQILEDVDGEPGAMPLLQHALWELWNRRHGRHLRASEYRAFGGVKQAIASTAEQVYGECSKVEQEQLREIFLRLTSLDKNDEGRDTRRRVSLSELAFSKNSDEPTYLLLDKLANARLIVKSVNGDKTEVEVVHEALIRHWERLRIWLNEDRDALRLRESVSESATEWEKSGKHESLLNSRWVKLDEALLLVQDSRYRLTEIEQAYLKGCVGLRNREQREREKSLGRAVVASVIAAVIFLVLGSFGLVKSNEATSQAATAQANANMAISRQLTIQSQTINNDMETKLLLNIISFNLFRTKENEDFLQNPPLGYIADKNITMQLTGKISSVAFSHNGKFFAGSSSTGDLIIADMPSGRLVLNTKFGVSVFKIAFSPDDKYLVAGGCLEVDMSNPLNKKCIKGSTRVYEIPTGKVVIDSEQNGLVQYLAISNDGKYIASGGCDHVIFDSDGCDLGIVRVIEIPTGKEIASVDYNGWVLFVAFSNDGTHLYSAGRGGLSKTLDIQTGDIEIVKMPYDRQIAISYDGEVLVSIGCVDSCAKSIIGVFDKYTGKETILTSLMEVPNFVVFKPDPRIVNPETTGTNHPSHYFLTLDSVWAVTIEKDSNGYESRKFLEYKKLSGKSPITFSPQGDLYISGNKVFDLETGNELFYFPDESINSTAISYDGNYAVTGSDEGHISIWGIILPEIPNFPPDVGDVNWDKDHQVSPDGKYSIEMDGENFLVNVNDSGKVVAQINKKGMQITRFGFSNDGRYIVARGFNGNKSIEFYRLWRTDDLITDACSRVARNLTRAEWEQYIGDALPYQAVCPNLPIEPESTP